VPCNFDEGNSLGFARLEAHRGTGWDVEAPTGGCAAVEIERAVRLRKMVVTAYLNRSVTQVRHLYVESVATFIDHDLSVQSQHFPGDVLAGSCTRTIG
jgi:hypothetical protein